MMYVGCGVVIVGTHIALRNNQWVHRKNLFLVIIVSLLVILFSVLVSTWVNTLLPTIITTLVVGTLLQIRFSSMGRPRLS